MGGPLVQGRDALRQQAWGDAYANFASADREDTLEPADLEGAALAAYLTGRDEECEALWTRSHRAWLDAGELGRAARCAFWLGLPLLMKGDTARGGGWLARGGRLLDEAGSDSAERGLMLAPLGLRGLAAGDPASAMETFGRVEEIGERFGDPDVLAFGRLGGGQARIALGQVTEGVAMLDEAMVAVTADDVSPIATGLVYCAVLLACQKTFDLARAQEWTTVLSRWCDSQQDLVPFRGDCLVHRAEILQLRGQWSDGLAEARRACDWLSGRPGAGRAHYQLGELHRLRGEFAEANRNYRAASALGRQPQPGCALLRLSQNHADAATMMIERALEGADESVVRARVLPAYVEISLATQAVSAARTAADELCALATDREAPLLDAIAAQAVGNVLVAEGDPRGACAALQESCLRWQELGVPYELARARVAMALACRETGDEASAEIELDAARATLSRLGAAPDLESVDRLSDGPTAVAYVGLSSRELEVLSLVAGGHTNREIAAALVISSHTVRRHLQNIFGKLGVSSRTAATAYALQHELVDDARVARTDH